MEIAHRDAPLGIAIGNMDRRIERAQRHRHVSGIGGDTLFAGAEDRMQFGNPVDRAAAATGLALVARLVDIHEIEAPRALAQIAAGGGLVAQLLRRPGQDRPREHGIVRADPRMHCGRRIGGQRADAQPAIIGVLDLRKSHPVDVRQLPGGFDLQLHQVEQIGPAGYCSGFGFGEHLRRICQRSRAAVLEGPHVTSSSATSRIAATMLA